MLDWLKNKWAQWWERQKPEEIRTTHGGPSRTVPHWWRKFQRRNHRQARRENR